jgi:hypothetical protein
MWPGAQRERLEATAELLGAGVTVLNDAVRAVGGTRSWNKLPAGAFVGPRSQIAVFAEVLSLPPPQRATSAMSGGPEYSLRPPFFRWPLSIAAIVGGLSRGRALRTRP